MTQTVQCKIQALDQLNHFNVNFQFTIRKNIPLTDYLSRHPIANGDKTDAERKTDDQDEIEAEEEFVVIQNYGLFEFVRTKGSIMRNIEQSASSRKRKKLQHSIIRMNKTK